MFCKYFNETDIVVARSETEALNLMLMRLVI